MAEPTKRETPWFVWAILIGAIVILVLVTQSWMQQVTQTEHEWLWATMGETEASQIERTAKRWYDHAVVQSGAADATYNYLIPNREQIENARGVEHLGDSLFPLVQSRLQALFAVLYQMFLRLAMLVSWLPFLAVASVPAMLDGMMAWRIRRESFVNTSTITHRSAVSVIGWSPLVLLLALFVPIPMSPAFFPLIGVVIVIATVLVTANTQKRI